MLHYPLYVKESDSFIQAQKNLTDYCISLLKPLKNKKILEIGCGNGVQALYINANYDPLKITGIDLNKANIEIANSERVRTKIDNVQFLVDDAQNLKQIPSNSIDVLLNIESAFHYPDKSAFLKEVYRVLKHGGQYLIADILTTRKKREGLMKIWGKPMVHHFWNRKRYDEEFLKSELVINYSEDITNNVRKGWSIYRNWIPKIKKKSFFLNMAFRIFYIINVKLNIYFLQYRQQYIIFVGYKPVS
jgi:ubiquinone/menaquinone biosynthesis C-methylase UbiE